MLTLPDVRQRDDFSCGAACLAALLSFHGRAVPRWLKRLANPDRGMTADTLEAVLFAVFERPPIRGTMTVPDLKHFTGGGRPVVCIVDLGFGSHWVIAAGVYRGCVRFHNPTNGPNVLSAAAWLAAWRDTPATSPYQRFGICP